jgi:hypothetical protein
MSETMIMARLLMPPPPIPAIERKAKSIPELREKPQPISPIASRAKHSKRQFFLPKMSERRPLMSWNAVDATKKELPIQDVAVPVSRSADIAGIDVDTLVLSMKDTKRATDKAGIAIISRLGDKAFVCPPILRMLLVSLPASEGTELDSFSCAASFAVEHGSSYLIRDKPCSTSDVSCAFSNIAPIGNDHGGSQDYGNYVRSICRIESLG